MLTLLLSLSRTRKRVILLLADGVLVSVALAFAFGLLHESLTNDTFVTSYLTGLPYLMIFAIAGSYVLRLAEVPLQSHDAGAAGPAAVLSGLLAFASWSVFAGFGYDYPVGLHVVFGLTYFLLFLIGRLALLSLVTFWYRRSSDTSRVLIYGAGVTGKQLASALRAHKTTEPVAFVDDNVTLHGLRIARLPVYPPTRIAELVVDKQISRVIIATGSMNQAKQARLINELNPTGVAVQALPSFAQLIGETPLLDKLTNTSAHALLGRDEISESTRPDHNCYENRVVLITGAGGSIGSELCHQVLRLRPSKLVLFELSELALYTVLQELETLFDDSTVEIVGVLGSVTEARQVRKVMVEHQVQVVLHAAAYKHVPLVEDNPLAGLVNNVLGTQTLVQQSIKAGVERFILISSDKAVRPTSVMGASKRLAEGVLQNAARQFKGSAGPIFTTVRFGNVLGSSGSVVPLFQEQLSRGGPITLTDPHVMRYFMTVQEAVKLVLESGSMATGGEVFVLDMGQPVSISQLARQMVENAGYSVKDASNPKGDIEIQVTGLRRGEKLVEELTLTANLDKTRHPKIFSAHEVNLSEAEIQSALRRLREAFVASDEEMARHVAMHFVESPDMPEDRPAIAPKLA